MSNNSIHFYNLVKFFKELEADGVPREEAPDGLEYDPHEKPATKQEIEEALNCAYGLHTQNTRDSI